MSESYDFLGNPRPRAYPISVPHGDLVKRVVMGTGSQALAERESFYYIQNLANQSKMDIGSWDMKIFHDYNAYYDTGIVSLIKDKTEINRIFFQEMERIKSTWTGPHEGLAEAQFKPIDAAEAEKIRNEMVQYRSQLYLKNWASNILSANSLMDQANTYIRQAASDRKKADHLIGVVHDIEQKVNSILALGFFSYLNCDRGVVNFKTNEDIILEKKNDLAGTHFRVNFGRFKVSINPALHSVKVSLFERNVIYDGYYHPHVSSRGEICWGNVAQRAATMTSVMDYEGVFRLLQSNLVNYNEDNPYISLSSFQTKQPESKPDYTPPPKCEECGFVETSCECCSSCSNYGDNCTCTYCEICDERVGEEAEHSCCTTCSSMDCQCCGTCDRSPDNCTCCHECGDDPCSCTPDVDEDDEESIPNVSTPEEPVHGPQEEARTYSVQASNGTNIQFIRTEELPDDITF